MTSLARGSASPGRRSSNANSLCGQNRLDPGNLSDLSKGYFATTFLGSRPPTSASQSVSNASHMKVAQKPRVPRGFADLTRSPCEGVGNGGGLPGSCLGGALVVCVGVDRLDR